MYLMLQQENPEDYVIATGKTTSVKDLVITAFKEVGAVLEFNGEGKNETGSVKLCEGPYSDILIPGKTVVKVDPSYFRPTEVDLLIGDPSKAKRQLGWEPECTFEELIKEMVHSDLKLMQKQRFLKDSGYTIKNYFE
jgi:GDPmannose 4,6-dehydratase